MVDVTEQDRADMTSPKRFNISCARRGLSQLYTKGKLRNEINLWETIKTIKPLTKNLTLPIKSRTSVQRPPILLDLLKRWAGFQCMWWWCLHVINYVFHLWNLAANYNDIGVWYREALKGKDELFLILLLWRIYIFLNMLKSLFPNSPPKLIWWNLTSKYIFVREETKKHVDCI